MSPAIGSARVHHPGFVVSDLERSIDFYREAFGAEVMFQLSGLTGPETAALNDLPDCEMSLAMLAFPSGQIELLAFERPDNAGTGPASAADVGSGHFALEVEDAEASYAALAEIGVTMLGAPLHVEEGPGAGMVVAFCRDPDGNRIELLQMP